MRYDELTARAVQAGLGVVTAPEERSDSDPPGSPTTVPAADASGPLPDGPGPGPRPEGEGPGSPRPPKALQGTDPFSSA